jgi:hypothetical protein
MKTNIEKAIKSDKTIGEQFENDLMEKAKNDLSELLKMFVSNGARSLFKFSQPNQVIA